MEGSETKTTMSSHELMKWLKYFADYGKTPTDFELTINKK